MNVASRLVRQLKAVPAARLYPRISLSHCDYCGGTGKYKAVVAGQWRELSCTQCAGKGSIVVDAA